MIRLLLIFLLGFKMVFDIIAQQDPQFSQYMYNQLVINPGYAGSQEAICLTGVHRQQWMGLPGAPTTSVFTVSTPFVFPPRRGEDAKVIEHGFGLLIMNDQIGFNQNTSIGASYAYRFSPGFSGGKLGIGISGIYFNKQLDATWRVPGGGDASGDIAIPEPQERIPAFDMGLGIFYSSPNVYMGISATHLLEPKFYENASYKLRRQYYATAGTFLPFQNPAWEFAPSLIAHSDGTIFQLAANANFIYNKKVWGGMGYRLNDAVIVMIGFDIFNGLKIGYAFDYTYTNLQTQFTAGGSHEIVLNYCFNLIKERVVKKYKSVRFL